MYKLNFKKIIAFILAILSISMFFLVEDRGIEEHDQYSIPVATKETRNITNKDIKTKENIAILEIGEKRYEGEVKAGMTAYDFINTFKKDGQITFSEKNYIGIGKFIESINNIKGNKDYAWIYYINGKKAQVGVSDYKINIGDIVSFKYEKAIY